MKTSHKIIPLFVGVALLLLVGCDEDKYELKFSHYVHVTDNDMDCDECHGDLGGPSFNTLSHETCTDCHDEPEAEEINKDTCGYCHDKKLLPTLKEWKPEPEAPRRKLFVHTEAVAGKCPQCHVTIMSENMDTVPRLQREDIVEIRDDAHHSGQDCLMCHVDMDRYQEPPNHDLNWTRRHGQFGMQDDAACSVCHSEDSCRECHSVMQPVSHNNMWRLRTHGIVSAWDRQRCMVCHEEDSCTSCHSQVKPRSHGPLWDERHGTWEPGRCMVCHEPDSCNTCHSENSPRSHRAALWDERHGQLGLDLDRCYTCHEPDFCNACHSQTSPRSHRASWDDRHCTQCHITAGESCVVCHEGGNNVELHQDDWPSFHEGFNNQTDCFQCH